MNEYLAAYLLLGLPASVFAALAWKAKWYAFFLIYPSWPFWSIAAAIYSIMPKHEIPCGYCGEILPPDKAEIMAHVQQCEANPLVQKLWEISTEHQEALLELDELREACKVLIMAIAHDMRNENDEDFEPLLALKKAMMEVSKLVKDKSNEQD